MQWEKGTELEAEKPFEVHMASKIEGNSVKTGLGSMDKEFGPIAMYFDENLGCVAETSAQKVVIGNIWLERPTVQAKQKKQRK